MPWGKFASSDPARGRLSHRAARNRGFLQGRLAPGSGRRSRESRGRKKMNTPMAKPGPQTGAGLLVKSLEAQGVEYIFGIPGAKIDKVFDTLLDSKIKTVVCRHEQNAAFIAGGIGRMTGKADGDVLTPVAPETLGPADADAIAAAVALINAAEQPVLLLGLLASQPRAAEAVRVLLAKTKLPVVCTYQGAGVVPRELFDYFAGRVGLFHNQPADKLLDAADVVVTVGYNPVEYEPGLW